MTPTDDIEALAQPGWVPLVIVLVMFVAIFFLGRSMRRMLRTIDPDLPHKADLEAADLEAAELEAADPEAAEQGEAAEERAVDRARRGEAPAGQSAGLVSPPKHPET